MKKSFIALTLFAAQPLLADEEVTKKLMTEGQALYATCMACHGQDGKGTQAGPSKMAPSLEGSAIVIGDPAALALVLLKGIAKEKQDYLGMMMPLEASLPTDDKLAAIMTYVRSSFGNKSAVVTPEEATKFREQWKDVKAPVTRVKIAEVTKAKP
jgi:mono/diheme cytochrome c family protein